jgi:hypothetical protein
MPNNRQPLDPTAVGWHGPDPTVLAAPNESEMRIFQKEQQKKSRFPFCLQLC